MRDKYKYLALIQGRNERLALLKDVASIRTEKLKPVVEAFSANVRRSSVMAIAFSEIAYQARRDQACANYAEFVTHKKVLPALEQLRKTVSTVTPESRQEYHRQYEQCQSIDRNELGHMLTHWGAGWIQVMLDIGTGMEKGIEAVLSSTVIESWMTFEHLASDLWVRAVDVGPTVLRTRLQASRKLLNPDDNIGVAALGEIDPQRKFGSSLREIGRVSFQRLEYIKRFYSIAFDHDFDRFFQSIDNGYIKALSAIRNVLVHNAGKADKAFRKQVEAFPELRKIALNKPVRLNGENVKRLETVSHQLGAKLIHFVDDVLTPP